MSLVKIDEVYITNDVASFDLGGANWNSNFDVYQVVLSGIESDDTGANRYMYGRVLTSNTAQTDAEYDGAREEHLAITYYNNSIYWGWNNGYYYYYGKPHYYPWYYYYNACPPSYYNATTHIIINKPVIKPTHKPNRPVVKPTHRPNVNIKTNVNRNKVNIKTNKSHNSNKRSTNTRRRPK